MLVTPRGFQLYAEGTLRADAIKCDSATTPRLNFPNISVSIATATERVPLPAHCSGMRVRITTTRALEIPPLEAIFTQKRRTTRNTKSATMLDDLVALRAIKPTPLPARDTVFALRYIRVSHYLPVSGSSATAPVTD
jgi:hypothetical protein